MLEPVVTLEPRLAVILELLERIAFPRERHQTVYASALPAVTRRLMGSLASFVLHNRAAHHASIVKRVVGEAVPADPE